MPLVHNHNHVCFRERNGTSALYTFVILIFNIFQIATLPPELWRECMRWATIPPSGRLPLDDSLTALDPWPTGIPRELHRFLYPETAYGFEQSRLYRTKRALMLVSRAWAELAVEYMYESLVIGHFGVGRSEQVFAALEGSAGFMLKKWVKRVDVWLPSQSDYVCERLARIGLLNLRVQNRFYKHHIGTVPFGNLLSEQPLHLVEPCGSPILNRLTSRGEAFGSLRCLTLWMVKPLPKPLHLPSNLCRLTIIAFETDHLRVQNIFSTRDSVALPNLTHLALHHRYPAPYRFVRFIEIISHIGPQLRHLTITANRSAGDWTGPDLCTILCVCTQLTELVIPSPRATWKADPGDYKHSTLQTLGFPLMSSTSELDFKSYFGIFSRREAFPTLGTIRLVLWRVKRADRPWVETYALHLRVHGIGLEDCCGHPLPPVSVLDDQNQDLLSGRIESSPLIVI